MAEPLPSSLSEFQKQFDDQLTCNVCLEQYANPKTLPCHHSFCLKCIEQLPVEIKVTFDVADNHNYTQFIHDTCISSEYFARKASGTCTMNIRS